MGTKYYYSKACYKALAHENEDLRQQVQDLYEAGAEAIRMVTSCCSEKVKNEAHAILRKAYDS